MHEGENGTDVPQKGGMTDKHNLFIAAIGVLVIMSAVQVFQTQKLFAAVSSGAIKTSGQSGGSSIGLPSQVGGCG